MKMLDHLLEIGDNPVRLQLLEASCVGLDLLLVLWLKHFFFFSPSLFLFFAVCSRTQRHTKGMLI